MSLLGPSHDPRRSRSRRRRSNTSDDGSEVSKVRRIGVNPGASPSPRSPGPESLCAQCQALDLNEIFASHNHISSSTGHFLAYLEWSATTETSSVCVLCAFLEAMRIPLPDRVPGRIEAQEHGYHLRAFSATSSYLEFFARSPNRKLPLSGDIMLGVVPNGLFSDKTNQSRYASTFGAVGYILPVALSSTAPWLTGRRVDPHQVNYPLVQEWLHFCKKNHGCRMRYSRPDNLQMIDCKTMQTVTAPPNCNYFALSYVWGKAKTAPPLSEPYSSPELLRNAAPVVRDAIQVVKSLGGRYIWVDKYCIPQNDPHLKGEQLSRMDLIYEGAYCTIVAAAGENDQHGLPGISRRRDLQPSIKVRDNYFVSTLLDPQQEIRKSVWMTRAWTYQEALCSARRLIFTEHQVYFECKVMHSCEAVDIPYTLLHSRDRKALQSYVRPMLFRDEWLQGTDRFGPMSAFWSVVKYYSDRRMTYDSDALNALEGILRRFQTSPSFVFNVLGIPLHAADKDDRKSLLDPKSFISGLSWHHTGSPRRRAEFPSWTWAGWEGSIGLQRTPGASGYETTMKLWVNTKEGNRVPWEEFWNNFWTVNGRERCFRNLDCLVVEAKTFKVQLTRPQTHHSDFNTPIKAPTVDMVNPYTGFRYASISLPLDLVDNPRVKSDLWDCIVLGKKAKTSGVDVMLIRWSIDSAERIWAGTLFSHKYLHESIEGYIPPLFRRRINLR